ncbi:glycosyltransferase family 2 protein [Falsiporphyromonas endometrii]|uniref:Glycosyltransferase family 2 protein n=1 Tax=Falsiporphyromonas endometrii TaxID=1387297 RepID=A0ABV9K943_9PORP
MHCAVIILNWNGAELLRKYLPHLICHTSYPHVRLIVADNGSTDDSLDVLEREFPQIEVIPFEKNYGFAEGYNRAISMVDEPIICLLNSDVRVAPKWIEHPLEAMSEDRNIAALQPKIRWDRDPKMFEYAGGAGGMLDRYGYPFCRGRVFDTLEEDRGQYDASQILPVLWASGAALFVRREIYLALGGLDKRFFAHQEEIDLCWRMNAGGYFVGVDTESVVYHYGGASLDMAHPKKTYLNFRNNLLLLYKNLVSDRYSSVMRMRFVLDMISMVQFALTGKVAHAKAVYKARKDFKRMKSDFAVDREENLRRTVNTSPQGIRTYSIVWRYFVGRKKTFSELER